MPIKTRRFAPKQAEALTPRGPASQYLTKNRGRPAEGKPAPGPVPRMKHQRQARAVARRSIQNRLGLDVRADASEETQWLTVADVAMVLGKTEADTYAQHLRGDPPKFQERRNPDTREFELVCSIETLGLHLIAQADPRESTRRK